MHLRNLVVSAVFLVAACAPNTAAPPPQATAPTPTASYQTLVDAADRSSEDRAMDAGRHAAELLQFMQVQPGMRVAELFAATGYTTELLARAVGPDGSVYAENPKGALEKFAAGPWGERLKKPIMSKVVRLDRELDDPFPADLKNLDIVVNVLNYHDTVWLKVDRDKMNHAVHEALKPGGAYVIVDHSARAGTGLSDVQTLHRIEQATVVDELQKAGFSLANEAAFLRNPQDTRDWNASPRVAPPERRGTTDRFVLKFVRQN